MNFLEALILGIVQGITEWLPISSEGINSLIMLNFFNKTFTEAVYQSIWLHLGTMLAALVYFRKTIWGIIKNLPNYRFRNKNQNQKNKLTTFLIRTTLISGILGGSMMIFGLEKLNLNYSSAMAVIGVALIITGILQFKAKSKKSKSEIHTSDSFIIGLAQSFSVLPGISRSGITISSLLLRNFSGKDALRLSFLLSIPLVFGAEIGIVLLGKVNFSVELMLAVLISFITGIISIKLLIKFAEKINWSWFCVIVGILSIVGVFI